MDAGKPWESCGFLLGVTRVSVLVLPFEACESHTALAAPNPHQPWLPNPAPLQAWASPCRTAPCQSAGSPSPFDASNSGCQLN